MSSMEGTLRGVGAVAAEKTDVIYVNGPALTMDKANKVDEASRRI
jgi:hypothetical protein